MWAGDASATSRSVGGGSWLQTLASQKHQQRLADAADREEMRARLEAERYWAAKQAEAQREERTRAKKEREEHNVMMRQQRESQPSEDGAGMDQSSELVCAMGSDPWELQQRVVGCMT